MPALYVLILYEYDVVRILTARSYEKRVNKERCIDFQHIAIYTMNGQHIYGSENRVVIYCLYWPFPFMMGVFGELKHQIYIRNYE